MIGTASQSLGLVWSSYILIYIYYCVYCIRHDTILLHKKIRDHHFGTDTEGSADSVFFFAPARRRRSERRKSTWQPCLSETRRAARRAHQEERSRIQKYQPTIPRWCIEADCYLMISPAALACDFRQ